MAEKSPNELMVLPGFTAQNSLDDDNDDKTSPLVIYNIIIKFA
jgi:hypothetical protein